MKPNQDIDHKREELRNALMDFRLRFDFYGRPLTQHETSALLRVSVTTIKRVEGNKNLRRITIEYLLRRIDEVSEGLRQSFDSALGKPADQKEIPLMVKRKPVIQAFWRRINGNE